MLARFYFRQGQLIRAFYRFLIGSAYDLIDRIVSLSCHFLVVGEIDDIRLVCGRFRVLFAKLTQKSINIVFELVSLDL